MKPPSQAEEHQEPLTPISQATRRSRPRTPTVTAPPRRRDRATRQAFDLSWQVFALGAFRLPGRLDTWDGTVGRRRCEMRSEMGQKVVCLAVVFRFLHDPPGGWSQCEL